MKTIYKSIPFFLALMFTAGAVAQDATQDVLDARIEKTITIDKDGTEIPLHIKILEYRNYPEAEATFTDSTVDKAAEVTKLIAIDQMKDGIIENYLVIRYRKSITDSFELKSTPEGFAILVDDRELKYFHGNGVYFVDNADKDFFTVESFQDIL